MGHWQSSAVEGLLWITMSPSCHLKKDSYSLGGQQLAGFHFFLLPLYYLMVEKEWDASWREIILGGGGFYFSLASLSFKMCSCLRHPKDILSILNSYTEVLLCEPPSNGRAVTPGPNLVNQKSECTCIFLLLDTLPCNSRWISSVELVVSFLV